LPATPETVSAYLAALADTGLKASTIRRRKAAIAYTHRWCGFEPPTNADVVKKTLAGINRGLGTAPKQKPAATADIVEQVIHPIPTTTPTDLRDRALILLGFSGAFRRSELVGIDVEHIRHVREGIIIQLGGPKPIRKATATRSRSPRAACCAPLRRSMRGWPRLTSRAGLSFARSARATGSRQGVSAHGLPTRSCVAASPSLFGPESTIADVYTAGDLR
jgi:site-specific recombinase XerC